MYTVKWRTMENRIIQHFVVVDFVLTNVDAFLGICTILANFLLQYLQNFESLIIDEYGFVDIMSTLPKENQSYNQDYRCIRLLYNVYFHFYQASFVFPYQISKINF